MSYTSDYKNSKLMEDKKLLAIIDQILSLDLGDELIVGFDSEAGMKKTRYHIYSVLNSMERKGDFVIRRRIIPDRLDEVLMGISPRPSTEIKSVRVVKKESN